MEYIFKRKAQTHTLSGGLLGHLRQVYVDVQQEQVAFSPLEEAVLDSLKRSSLTAVREEVPGLEILLASGLGRGITTGARQPKDGCQLAWTSAVP